MNKTKPSFLFFIGSCLLFILAEQSCVHKENNGGYGTRREECTPTRDSLLQWYRFKTGTYWIYEDAATGVLDSCRVNHHVDTVYTNGLWEFEVGISNYLDNSISYYYYQSTDVLTSLTSPPCKIMPIWASVITPTIDECRLFFYPLDVTEHIYHSAFVNGHFVDGETSIDAKFSHIQIGGVVYNNVVRFRVTGDILNEGRTSVYEVGKNVGILHKSLQKADSTWQDWNLVRMNIIE